MTENQRKDTTSGQKSNLKKTLFISFGILVAAAIVVVIIFMTEPKAKRAGATKQTAMLVDVMTAERDTFRPVVSAMGTVTPSQDIILSPRVNGEIISLSKSFTPGSFIEKGETLLQIDPSDYKNELQLRESDLRQAVSDLKIEMGRQNIAEKDYQLLNETLSEEQEALILRKPQLNAARSAVEAARASVEQAKLNLNRTTIKAPFDAHILTRNVNVGSQVATGQDLGRLVGIDTYWIEATVPLSKLRWLTFPDDDASKGSKVKIHNRAAWNEEEFRTGHLYKLVGTLEDRTRMARVLVSVPDPLAHEPESEGMPVLMLGSFVEVQIHAKPLPDVIRLSRDYLRKDETVWVMEKDSLRIHEVGVIFRDQQYAYISEGLSETDSIVKTNLTTVVDGAPLRTEGDPNDGSGDGSSQ
jgi:RND family efflux transporter MFP subunit